MSYIHYSNTKITGVMTPPVTSGYPSQRASNTENVSIWWRRHVTCWVQQYIRCQLIVALWCHMVTQIWVNLPHAGNGVLPDGNKPLPEPMLTCYQPGPLADSLELIQNIHNENRFDNNTFEIQVTCPRGQWVNCNLEIFSIPLLGIM